MENTASRQRYAFESFRFDAAAGELRGPTGSVKLRPQAALALGLLLSRPGEVVSRTELRAALWPDERVVMFEASIAAVIRELRRALGDDSKTPRFIETVPKRGYRFVALPAAADPVLPAAAETALPKTNRGGFLRISAGLALALVALLIGNDRSGSEGPAPGAIPVTVAVLPFEDLSLQPEHRVLTKTLPRELIGWLAGMAPERLRIVDRTTAHAASGDVQAAPPADFIIRGSVGDDRDAAVVATELLSGADAGVVWSERYRRNPEDAGLTARELAARIADRVASEALPQWSNGSGAVTANAKAAGAFHRGAAALSRQSTEGVIEAVDAFRLATELDPEFAAAHAHLAAALVHWMGPAITPDRVERAREAALRSLELAPTNAVGHRVLGEIGLYYDRDWEAAGKHLERSVELSPSAAPGHDSYAAWLSARGRHEEALREIDLAAVLDPGSVTVSIDAMLMHYYARDFDGTISAARRLQKLWPGNDAAHRYVVLSGLAMGDDAAAAAEARVVLTGAGATSATTSAEAVLTDSEALEAYWARSRHAVADYVNERSGDPTALAMMQVQLDRLDAANAALEAALAPRRFSYFLPFLGVSPAFDRMCGHPGFERILRRLDQSALRSGTDLPRCAAAIARMADSVKSAGGQGGSPP